MNIAVFILLLTLTSLIINISAELSFFKPNDFLKKFHLKMILLFIVNFSFTSIIYQDHWSQESSEILLEIIASIIMVVFLMVLDRKKIVLTSNVFFQLVVGLLFLSITIYSFLRIRPSQFKNVRFRNWDFEILEVKYFIIHQLIYTLSIAMIYAYDYFLSRKQEL